MGFTDIFDEIGIQLHTVAASQGRKTISALIFNAQHTLFFDNRGKVLWADRTTWSNIRDWLKQKTSP